MDHVLTLIAPSAAAGLVPAVAEAARSALRRLGAETAPPDWLAPALACDLAFSGLAPEQAEAAARAAVGERPLDLIAQPQEGRRKRLLVTDMESTVIHEEMLDELGRIAGLGEQIALITARAMNGEIDFRAAVRERVALLKDLPLATLDQAWALATLDPGALALVRTMKAAGAGCLLVSGGFRHFTRRLADQVGFDGEFGNELEVAEGRLTGRVIEPILDKNAKLEALIGAAAARQLPLRETLAVGDGANDLPMIDAAGLGVAYHAKPVVAAAATHRLDHADLSGLLYAQGYRAAEIIHG